MRNNADNSMLKGRGADGVRTHGSGVLQGVGWRLEQHDRGRIELKLRYDLPPESGRAHYRANLYLFVPRNLGIGPRRYHHDDFFEDLQSYTRYLAPMLSLRGLADYQSPHHPLGPVVERAASTEPPSGGPAQTHKLTHAIKLYGAALSEALDEERNFLRRQVYHAPRSSGQTESRGARHLSAAEIVERSGRLVDAVEKNVSAFRRLHSDLLGPHLDAGVTTSLDAVDEYISLEAEETLFKTLSLLNDVAEANGEVVDRAKALIRSETEHRAAQGLTSRVSPDADDQHNEAYQYRHGVLKKFAASALFLNVRRSRLASRAGDIIAAVAAGLAMTFALIVALLSTRYARWSIYSTQWIVVAVVAYMFKDRIKEWLRVLGSRQLSRWLSDRRGILRDESIGKRIGTVSETLRYVEHGRLDRTIRAIRLSDPLAHLELERGEECILCYTREVELYGGENQAGALTDILRYDFDRYTRRMDDPLDPVSVLEPDGRTRVVMTPRVYRVNLVLRVTDLSPEAAPSVEAFVRVILTRAGIRRLEFAG